MYAIPRRLLTTADVAEPRSVEIDCEEPVRTLEPLELHLSALRQPDPEPDTSSRTKLETTTSSPNA